MASIHSDPNEGLHTCARQEKGCDCEQLSLIPSQRLDHPDLYHTEYGRRTGIHGSDRRFRRTLAVFCKGLLLGLAISAVWPLLRFFRNQFRPHTFFHADFGIHSPKIPRRLECVIGSNWTEYYEPPAWSDAPYGAETSFSLPIDADALYLLSRGAYQQGQVNIVQSTVESDTVDVNVRVAYPFREAIHIAVVCLTESLVNERGIGIFTPEHKGRWPGKQPLQFDITLTLPAGKDGNMLKIRQLETQMSNYHQNVADLWDTVSFDLVGLASESGNVTVKSITTAIGGFVTSNGHLAGHFNAEYLGLISINGGIETTVTLLNQEGANPSKLAMHVPNGPIKAGVALVSASNVGGKFNVEALNVNGGIDLAFTESPVDAFLKCIAKSTIGKVHVSLAPAYEGTFTGIAILGSVSLMQQDIEDPTGQGRHRQVVQSKAGKRVDGSVFWVDSDGSHSENESSVQVLATTSSVELIV
ncbi:hypothetical protein ID866_6865 [Astraeus odoratus]|nr:hypothetical protein ID866_6865 [Astraeus odoratus]